MPIIPIKNPPPSSIKEQSPDIKDSPMKDESPEKKLNTEDSPTQETTQETTHSTSTNRDEPTTSRQPSPPRGI